jgi:hypothetical protein
MQPAIEIDEGDPRLADGKTRARGAAATACMVRPSDFAPSTMLRALAETGTNHAPASGARPAMASGVRYALTAMPAACRRLTRRKESFWSWLTSQPRSCLDTRIRDRLRVRRDLAVDGVAFDREGIECPGERNPCLKRGSIPRSIGGRDWRATG